MDVDAVVQSAATALATAAGTSVFADARAGVLALFRRGGRDERETAELLDEADAAAREVLPERRDDTRANLTRDWQVRLSDLVRRNPDLAEDVLTWVRETEERLPSARQMLVQNVTATAPGSVAQGVQDGTIVNHHYASAAADTATERS
ncbi:hypothetical protein [Streptomyces sp. 1222.5]|uniref:hypothetical protein n=1 Tax=Streptomyces sp. 1222.5 TaxID=1881026 RepID=UPI003D74433E